MPTRPHSSSSSPNLRRVGAHRGLDGEHVPAQGLRRRPLAEQVPGLLARSGGMAVHCRLGSLAAAVPHGEVRHRRRRAAVRHDRARRQQERGAAAARVQPAHRRGGRAAQRPAHPRRRGDARPARRPRRARSSGATTNTVVAAAPTTSRKTDVDAALAERIRASFLAAGPLLARFGAALMPPPGGDVIGRRRLDPHLDAFRALGATRRARHATSASRAPDGGLQAVRLLHGRAVRDGHRERADGRRADRRHDR